MARIAIIDIGTFTERLALAHLEGGRISSFEKRSKVCDLGAGVDATGMLSADAIRRVLERTEKYLRRAREAGAERVCCTMTSAARDAANAAELIGPLEELGLSPQVIPGEVEGGLTFGGVASAIPDTELLVADNGGGSTELVRGSSASPARIEWACSLAVGCRRVTDRCLPALPPSPDDLAAAHALCRERFEAGLAEQERLHPGVPKADLLAVCGGTATTLAALDLTLEAYDSARVHLHRLGREAVARLEEMLASLSLEQTAALPGFQAKRAPVILGGCIALAELMDATGFDELTVSESDLLRGLCLACADDARPVFGWRPVLSVL